MSCALLMAVTALLLVSVARGAGASEAPATTRRAELHRQKVAVPPDVEVEVWIPSGNVIVDGGVPGHATVEIEKRVDCASPGSEEAAAALAEALESVRVHVELRDRVLRIVADRPGSYPKGFDHSFFITALIPADAPLDVRVENGSASVSEMNGYVHVDVTNGQAMLDSCRGAVDVDVANGKVRCTHVLGRAAVALASGQLDVVGAACDQSQEYRVGVGSLRAELTGQVAAGVDAEVEVGRIQAGGEMPQRRGVGTRLTLPGEEGCTPVTLRVGVGTMSLRGY